MTSLRQPPQNPQSPTYPLTSVADVYGQQQPSTSFPVYTQSVTSGQLPLTDSLINATSFARPQQPISPPFQTQTNQQPTSMQNLAQAMESVAPQETTTLQDFGGGLFEAPDMNQYNFDPASFNFGNHYGALEFGMLGHMSSGAGETPSIDTTSQLNQATGGGIPTTYADATIGPQSYMFGQEQTIGDWRPPTQPQSNIRQQNRPTGLFNANGTEKQDLPGAFSIGSNSAFASPTSELSPSISKNLDDLSSTKSLFTNTSAPSSQPSLQSRSMPPQPQVQPQVSNTTMLPPSRRRGDPSQVYSSVTQPYSYTAGFHSLIAFIQKRFSSQKTLRIAKALASIRPSFLSCTKSLGYEDLIFMEKCFQRTLWEYEDFINACGTPTIVCRRTGEVAAVGKEFSILTGWKKDVLLGREANLNTNTGNSSGAGTASSSRGGVVTPRLPEGVLESASGKPQAVFLAELLDDDSVIEFYEDFARLAFGDSRGGVTTRCKLLKYRSKEDETFQSPTDTIMDDGRPGSKRKRVPGMRDSREGLPGEARIDELGDKDGRIECSCCWTVKRDLFDLPMMLVVFSPIRAFKY